MKKYSNNSGKSGVLAYETGADWIKVKFIEGGIYRYSHQQAGRHHVEQMKILAEKGRGLSTYISQHVKDRYDKI
jgi:hypothetical protein